jgi:hypothetical protein
MHKAQVGTDRSAPAGQRVEGVEEGGRPTEKLPFSPQNPFPTVPFSLADWVRLQPEQLLIGP